jgi:hypothetical protein
MLTLGIRSIIGQLVPQIIGERRDAAGRAASAIRSLLA